MEIGDVVYTVEDYLDICNRADYFGRDSLSEEEQYVLDNWQ